MMEILMREPSSQVSVKCPYIMTGKICESAHTFSHYTLPVIRTKFLGPTLNIDVLVSRRQKRFQISPARSYWRACGNFQRMFRVGRDYPQVYPPNVLSTIRYESAGHRTVVAVHCRQCTDIVTYRSAPCAKIRKLHYSAVPQDT